MKHSYIVNIISDNQNSSVYGQKHPMGCCNVENSKNCDLVAVWEGVTKMDSLIANYGVNIIGHMHV